jgi:hypothetical protein
LLEFDTSNSLFVHNQSQIISENHSTFDFRHSPSSFLTIREILRQNYLTKEEIFTGNIHPSISFYDLFHDCQCSKDEFENALKELGAINLHGYIKIAPPEIRNQITNVIISLIPNSQDWKKEFDLQVLIDYFDGKFPNNLIQAILDQISENGELSERKITRFIASIVLKEKPLTLDEFEEDMKGHLPPQIRFSLEECYGLFAFIDEKLIYVDEESLPIQVIERFNHLLQLCDIWEPKLLEPFFLFYVTKTLSFNDLATRYCRFADGFFMAL